jgi:acyl-coenzyme A thioesterase PaaI-like protein
VQVPFRFDVATDVARGASSGRWTATVDPAFSVGGRTNGGYLLALATRAALAELESAGGPHQDPVAVSGTFLSVTPPGPIDLAVEVLRHGRSTSVLRVSVQSPGSPPVRRLDAMVTCGALPGPSAAHRYDAVPPVALPEEQRCVRLPVHAPDFEVSLMGEMSERLDPASLGWVDGRPSGRGELRGWVRFDDDRPVDALSLLLVADCLPPATFDLGLRGWVPTMQLSVWLRAHPALGPLRVRQVARVVDDGSASAGRGATVDETCDVWDDEGTLVATGHQLAGLLLPRPGSPQSPS